MNWCFTGALSYLILFQASTWLTELLSAGKYADYRVYQQKVGKFLPKRVTKSMDAQRIEVDGKEEEKVKGTKGTQAAGKTKRR